MPDMNSVSMMERTFSMQLDFLKAIRSLVAYDKEHSQEPEKTRFLGKRIINRCIEKTMDL